MYQIVFYIKAYSLDNVVKIRIIKIKINKGCLDLATYSNFS